MLNNYFKSEHTTLRYLGKSVLSQVDTMEPWQPFWYFSMWCKCKNYFSIWVMLRCEGNSKHDRCTFPPWLHKDNNIFGYKEHKNHYYIVLAISERTNKPALNFSNDRFFLNQQLVTIIRMNHGAELTAELEPRQPRDTRDNFCVLKGDFLQCLWPGATYVLI